MNLDGPGGMSSHKADSANRAYMRSAVVAFIHKFPQCSNSLLHKHISSNNIIRTRSTPDPRSTISTGGYRRTFLTNYQKSDPDHFIPEAFDHGLN